MPADLSQQWISVSDYQTMFPDSTAPTTQISYLISMVSVALNNFLGYCPLESLDDEYGGYVTQIYEGNGTSLLPLNYKKVNFISSVTFDYGGNSPVTVDGYEFYIDASGYIQFWASSVYKRLFDTQFIEVVFSAGYAPLPQDLQLCCGLAVQMATIMFDGDNTTVGKRIKDGEQRWEPIFAKLLDKKDPLFTTCRTILMRYRNIFVY